ncbi:transposase for IS1668 [Actinobacillus minor NM305]|uniref:Transposase for IS1668 n=1 Tax=Actinobacillus minor NM305 TaxID=637911 RepID=C5S4H4_9PAST|nr:transposase for IS1668 [Actinobacillus minor NM305]
MVICTEITKKGFFYLDHRTVDGKHGIILDTFATAGNVNDSQPYIARLDATTQRFQFKPQVVGLDAGYFTAPIAESLARREIVGVFGYRRPTKGKNSLSLRTPNNTTDTAMPVTEGCRKYRCNASSRQW